jgi:hypothetical protein
MLKTVKKLEKLEEGTPIYDLTDPPVTDDAEINFYSSEHDAEVCNP